MFLIDPENCYQIWFSRLFWNPLSKQKKFKWWMINWTYEDANGRTSRD